MRAAGKNVPERILKLHLYAEVALRSVFTLHAHLEHARVTAACREGKDCEDLQEKKKTNIHESGTQNVREQLNAALLSQRPLFPRFSECFYSI